MLMMVYHYLSPVLVKQKTCMLNFQKQKEIKILLVIVQTDSYVSFKYPMK